MAVLTPALVSRSGVDVAGVAADAAGDEWTNTGLEYVQVKNGGGSPITVTLDITATVDGAAVTDPTVAVAAGITKIIGPFPTTHYNNTSNGRAKITYSDVTSVTVKVLKLPAA